MNFMEMLFNNLTNKNAVTENGAVGYVTSGKELVDLNFAAASLRNATAREIVSRFIKAYYEDQRMALKWLFFLRDIRGGMGERRTFRILLDYFAHSDKILAEKMIPLVAEYGRYDDLLTLFDTDVEEKALAYIQAQLSEDSIHMASGKSISLCAKWMPGLNTSSELTRRQAEKIRDYMHLTSKQYRKLLSTLRSYLNVVEVQMSAGDWQEITYEHVPSKANILYRNAFIRHDKSRRETYLEAVKNHTASIKAGVLMPHDIVTQYVEKVRWKMTVKPEDTSLELLWSNLPDTVNDAGNVLCVVDGSGSMMVNVGNTQTTALEVANAIGIYFAERLKGAYRNQYITFSSRPEYVNLSKCRNLREKLELALSHNDCSNTNIEATFALILDTAVRNRLSQSQLPQIVLILSDMEFDAAVSSNGRETLFQTMQRKYSAYGYKLPKLVFWNINSRTNVVPVRENELGVGLVSGFSPNVCRMVLSNELDPYKSLLTILNGERYQKIEDLLP